MAIRKSRQVNLDPLTGMCHCGTDVADHGPSDNHSPVEVYRPEFEPTRDPLPYKCGMKPNQEIRHGHGDVQHCSMPVWAPRREQFDNPVNQALVDFRNRFNLNGTRDDAAEWLEVGIDPWHYTPEDLDHAQRVLTRLANWRDNG